jgi:hypothetical protein
MTLENDWNRAVYSQIHFDRWDATISGYLDKKDFNDNIARFTYGDGTKSLKLRIVAMVLESTVAGPATDKSTLPAIEF